MVDDSIYTRLSTYVPLTNLVGSNVFAVNVPEDSGPVSESAFAAVVYMRISDDPFKSIDGAINLNLARFQFSCISNRSHRIARSIADAVTDALQGYSSGEILRASFAGGGMDLYDADETRMHHIPVDFFVSYAA